MGLTVDINVILHDEEPESWYTVVFDNPKQPDTFSSKTGFKLKVFKYKASSPEEAKRKTDPGAPWRFIRATKDASTHFQGNDAEWKAGDSIESERQSLIQRHTPPHDKIVLARSKAFDKGGANDPVYVKLHDIYWAHAGWMQTLRKARTAEQLVDADRGLTAAESKFKSL